MTPRPKPTKGAECEDGTLVGACLSVTMSLGHRGKRHACGEIIDPLDRAGFTDIEARQGFADVLGRPL